MNILVTGAAGFIGSETVRALTARGDQVIGVDNLNAYYAPALKHARLKRIEAENFQFIKADIADYDGLAIRSATKATADIINAADNLKVIGRAGIGTDNIDLDAATERGVMVVNAPNANTISAAEHTMALLFAVTKALPHQVARAEQGLKGEPIGRALELDGCTLGLIGIGRIASRVAVAAQALGMRVIATDPGVDASPVDGVTLVELDELLARVRALLRRSGAVAAGLGDERKRHMETAYRIDILARTGIVLLLLGGLLTLPDWEKVVIDDTPAAQQELPMLQLEGVSCSTFHRTFYQNLGPTREIF